MVTAVFEFFGEHIVLLMFIFVGLGMALGHVKVKSISLGAAAVLFIAIILTAIAGAQGVTWDASELAIVGELGLALFTYCIGITSGPNFFSSLKRGLGPIGTMVAVLILAAAAGVGVGKALGMDFATIAGTWAGSITNTPSLAAAGQASGNPAAATAGYSVTYLYGVLGMLAASMFALTKRSSDTDAPAPLVNLTVRVERTDSPSIRDIVSRHQDKLTFSRVRHGETNPILVAEEDDELHRDDLVTIVGPRDVVQQVADELGHVSSHNLQLDRRYLDFRRITLSNGKLSGRTLEELDLEGKYGATVSRVRRGDVDLIASDDLVLQPGDRLRVIAPTGRMRDVSKFLGDSARGLSDINPMALGLGMAVGMLIGLIPIPLPGGGTFVIGAAAGTLIVGLVLGRLGRIGPMITTMPHLAATALSEFGLLAFLAYAGLRAGTQVLNAFKSGEWVNMLITGFVITTIVAWGMYLAMRKLFHMGGTKLSGLLGGVQTQPAVLAYANDRTGFDNRVAMGYALVYPAAMVVKILIAQVIGGM